MSKEIQKQEIIRAIRSIAESSGGVPPGEKKFLSETGIANHTWRNRIWRKWSDALFEAGFSPLQWTGGYEDGEILQQVSDFSKRLGAFPTSGDLEFEGSNNPNFVSNTAIKRRWRIGELATELRAFAMDRGDDQVVAYCDDFLATRKSRPIDDEAANKPALGYVYLIKYGKDFKVGRTSSLARRSRQVQIELPDETVLVHAILTDDPAGQSRVRCENRHQGTIDACFDPAHAHARADTRERMAMEIDLGRAFDALPGEGLDHRPRWPYRLRQSMLVQLHRSQLGRSPWPGVAGRR